MLAYHALPIVMLVEMFIELDLAYYSHIILLVHIFIII
jgi:hypothetical protein